jgi:hypothetical protein
LLLVGPRSVVLVLFGQPLQMRIKVVCKLPRQQPLLDVRLL